MSPIPDGGYITIDIPQGTLFLRTNYDLSITNQDLNRDFENMTYTQWADGTIKQIKIANFCDYSNGTKVITNCTIGSAYSLLFSNIANPPSQINITSAIVI